jgi:hypothetical protein
MAVSNYNLDPSLTITYQSTIYRAQQITPQSPTTLSNSYLSHSHINYRRRS